MLDRDPGVRQDVHSRGWHSSGEKRTTLMGVNERSVSPFNGDVRSNMFIMFIQLIHKEFYACGHRYE